MPRIYDQSIRWRVIRFTLSGLQVKEICQKLEVSETFVKKVRRLYAETGSIEGKKRLGKARELSAREILLLRRLIEDRPELYLDEMAEWLQFITGRVEPFSVSLIERSIQRMGLSRLKLQIVARERTELARAQFRRRIAEFRRHQLLFIDESSKDNRNLQRKYGRGIRGTKVSMQGYFVRGIRYSVLGGINTQGAFGHCVVGSYDKNLFEHAVKHFILPHVGSLARGESNSVVIMDNCRIHDSARVLDMVRGVGGIVMFLPPYSPDLNPMEQAFNIAKTWIARNKEFCKDYPKRCFEYALSQIPPDVCCAEFDSCGYFA